MMAEAHTPLMSPPWTPLLDQSQFDSISPLLLDSTRSSSTGFTFAIPESPYRAPLTGRSSLRRPSLHGHKRYMSFPLSSLDSRPQPTTHTHARTMSCVTAQQGLGISWFDEPATPSLGPPSSCEIDPMSPLTDEHPSTPIKEEGETTRDDVKDVPAHGGSSTEDASEDVKVERPLTAAEMRAEKRKMKRFRLSHQQTRYLMSEFARQAHPDAAHRDKLSRAIPGLSSRQVQVWFQNRRAKLKRVTQDDRENIVRSRALPENFDLSTALQSPFGPPTLHSAKLVTPTSQPSSSMSSHSARSLAPATPHTPHSHLSLNTHFSGTNSQLNEAHFSPLAHETCRPYQDFQTCEFAGASLPTTLELDERGCPRQIQTPRQPPQTPQTCNFTSTPIQSTFDVLSPDMTPYGLGFDYGTIPGFQASSIHTIRNLSKLPGKVMIPRKTATSYTNMPDTPMYSSTACSPLGLPLGFPILSAPASVTSFAQYIQ